MTYYLQILRRWLTADLPPRCTKCRRYCLNAWESDMNAPVDKPVRRCWPDCDTR